MDIYYVYILQSLVTGRYYVGHTEDIANRLNRHNAGLVRSTKSKRPWQVVYSEEVLSKQAAYKREMQIKSYKGGEAFKRLLEK